MNLIIRAGNHTGTVPLQDLTPDKPLRSSFFLIEGDLGAVRVGVLQHGEGEDGGGERREEDQSCLHLGLTYSSGSGLDGF